MLDCPVQRIAYLFSIFILLGAFPAHAQAQDGASDLIANYEEAREYCVTLLNELRMDRGLSIVRLEPLSSELALRHAQDMAGREFFSHWNIEGVKPTRRYNLLGGMHGLGENIFYSEYQRGNWREFIDQAMRTLEDSPAHLETMLEPTYTDVGIGMAVEGERFYLVQEFVCRAGGDYSCPLEARVGDVVEFSGRFDPRRYRMNYILLRHEPLPEERSRRWLNGTGIYSEGDTTFAVYTPRTELTFDVDTFYDVSVGDDGSFTARLLLDYKGKPGSYYVLLVLHDTWTGAEARAAGIAVEVLR